MHIVILVIVVCVLAAWVERLTGHKNPRLKQDDYYWRNRHYDYDKWPF
jgi:uncharacterized protein YxeA